MNGRHFLSLLSWHLCSLREGGALARGLCWRCRAALSASHRGLTMVPKPAPAWHPRADGPAREQECSAPFAALKFNSQAEKALTIILFINCMRADFSWLGDECVKSDPLASWGPYYSKSYLNLEICFYFKYILFFWPLPHCFPDVIKNLLTGLTWFPWKWSIRFDVT